MRFLAVQDTKRRPHNLRTLPRTFKSPVLRIRDLFMEQYHTRDCEVVKHFTYIVEWTTLSRESGASNYWLRYGEHATFAAFTHVEKFERTATAYGHR